ncbi:hypothetical protein A2G24_01110 [Listeria monocytogenes]|uniref:Uncharacterized protein n=1 Tax=Listeria monocytogenes TaxID=1639 RepID=A0A823DG71_LISMN|nr:hypothetical protein [Listeria monocytogenes]EAD1012226.1 hypothetical protein [Listeria monocytogenes]EAD1186133.1 hypothetical protein [Listeria monocytogenes]EAF8898051.1 hypothetical protein [Listeria monocytogenes]
MSSELVKKLEANAKEYNDRGDSMVGFGIHLAALTVKAHESEQMKEPLNKSSQIALEQAKDVYLRSNANWNLIIYGIERHLQANTLIVISKLAEWAIEQEKMEEEK